MYVYLFQGPANILISYIKVICVFKLSLDKSISSFFIFFTRIYPSVNAGVRSDTKKWLNAWKNGGPYSAWHPNYWPGGSQTHFLRLILYEGTKIATGRPSRGFCRGTYCRHVLHACAGTCSNVWEREGGQKWNTAPLIAGVTFHIHEGCLGRP